MKLNRTVGKAAGSGVAVVAALLLALTFATNDNGNAAHPAPALPAPIGATPPASPPPADDAAAAAATPALALLEEIPAATDMTYTKYDRDLFGQRWADVDRNGCDTRNDMLRRDLIDLTFKAGTHDCVALTGTLNDPYTGETITFTRVSKGYQPVQVDHVIPLAAAWYTGAAQWSDDTRLQFANDPRNLQVTTANQTKGDRTPSSWMPPHGPCDYATRYVQVAHAYDLTLAPDDITALRSALTSCTPTH
ncbi:calcium-binding protein [Microbacterium sp. CH12i]|uniref:HNH endonuclease family protein n=1 Tax=Microbacterium sp. CH12i TaxID=1479651 RepID=UPI0004617BCC|nr:HNH endonuclease family protein [Microbacterium sp. CH12i]KDA04634.1 calcium-binding protein [Microbacterium sp. CH12i]